ncbi:MAG: diacylglycerol kinase family protein [Chloroflexi bacterium]|nr:diacylglycerol kinase family protein [Chloroflexota bacterium]
MDAGRGIGYGLRTQRHLRIHTAMAATALLTGWALRFSLDELALVTLLCAAIIAAELMNTAMEAVVDLTHPAHHPLAGAAKDAAAGAVLVLAAAAVVIGGLLYLPRLAVLAGIGTGSGLP